MIDIQEDLLKSLEDIHKMLVFNEAVTDNRYMAIKGILEYHIWLLKKNGINNLEQRQN